MRTLMNVIIYFKLDFSDSKAGMGTRFIGIIRELGQLLESEKCVLPPGRWK